MERKDWATLTISSAALFVALFTAYFTLVRRTDNLRILVDTTPDVSVDRDAKPMKVELAGRDMGIVFMNSGSRPISVLSMQLYVQEFPVKPRETDSANPTCNNGPSDAVWFNTNLDPIIVKEREIVRKTVWVRTGYKADRPMTFPAPSWLKKDGPHYTKLCVSFAIATPSRAFTTEKIELQRTFADIPNKTFEPDMRMPSPIQIVNEAATIFEN